jgi:hypothetical protein
VYQERKPEMENDGTEWQERERCGNEFLHNPDTGEFRMRANGFR